MSSTFNVPSAMKALQWERAKGELRGLIALQGSHMTGAPPNIVAEETKRWQSLATKVEAFIKIVEGQGLHE